MKLFFLFSLGLLFSFGQNPQKQPVPQGQTAERNASASHALSASESQFVQETLAAGRKEVEMAGRAVQQASDAGVKSFAQRLVTDHSAANRKLEEIARNGGVQIPNPANGSPDLAGLSGANYDKAFVKEMVERHRSGISKFEAAQKFAANAELRSFITSTLPTLREHLSQALTLEK